jgi:hypothetical protein
MAVAFRVDRYRAPCALSQRPYRASKERWGVEQSLSSPDAGRTVLSEGDRGLALDLLEALTA